MANNATDPTGRSIVTQVAFKAAVEAACAGGVYSEDTFYAAWPVFKEVLMTEVIAQQETYFEEASARKAERIADGTYQAPTPITDAFDAMTSLADNMGATPAGGVEVAGKQHGPLPGWLITAAAAKGVGKVWDNRIAKDGSDITQKTGKTPPWFKSTEGDIPFWPPRN